MTVGPESRIGLVSCVKSKRSGRAPAKDLYTSPLFAGARAAVEQSCDQWFILSALHGLVAPDEVLEPYEKTLKETSQAERRAWSTGVVSQLVDTLGDLANHTFEVHAGRDYYGHGLVDLLRSRGATVEIPPEGLSLGRRLAYYASGGRPSTGASRRPSKRAVNGPTSVQPPTGKYKPLYDRLLPMDCESWTATFKDLESILGFKLPASARRHQAWWANERAGTHSHARAWLAAGFVTTGLNLTAERVTFRRSS